MKEKLHSIAGEFFSVMPDPKELEEYSLYLVRYCAAIIEDAVDHREPASTYADKIKQHFGVEE
jgi:hypothetical protein